MLDCIGNDIIDTRDLIKEMEDMESDRQTMLDEIDEIKEAIAEIESDENATDEEIKELKDKLEEKEKELAEWEDDEDYNKMQEFIEECENSISGYIYGEALIEESYFVEYAEQLAEDLGYTENSNRWPCNHIDWDAAAEELKQDYTTFEVCGYTYYARA